MFNTSVIFAAFLALAPVSVHKTADIIPIQDTECYTDSAQMESNLREAAANHNGSAYTWRGAAAQRAMDALTSVTGQVPIKVDSFFALQWKDDAGDLMTAFNYQLTEGGCWVAPRRMTNEMFDSIKKVVETQP